MTRDEAIKEVGLDAVKMVEAKSCDFDQWDNGEGDVPFSAAVDLNDGRVLKAMYYQDRERVRECEALDDLSWTIDHYEIG